MKSIVHRITSLLDYVPNSTLSMTITERITGSIVITSVDAGARLTEQKSPFDTYIQIVEGIGVCVVIKENYILETGDGIVVPAHSTYYIFSNGQKFKMIITVIKNGYED